MLKKLGCAVMAMLIASPAMAADAIEGNWRSESGGTVTVSTCPDGYCMVVTSGANQGQSLGYLRGENGRYKGELLNPDDGKTYSGSGRIDGEVLKLKGCVLVFCVERQLTRL